MDNGNFARRDVMGFQTGGGAGRPSDLGHSLYRNLHHGIEKGLINSG